MRVVAGVDCHKSSHTAVFLNAVGQVIDRITFSTTEAGYEQALATAQRLGCTEWGVEGAGCYGYAFSVFARARGATVFEVPGLLTKRHRRHGVSEASPTTSTHRRLLKSYSETLISWPLFIPASCSERSDCATTGEIALCESGRAQRIGCECPPYSSA